MNGNFRNGFEKTASSSFRPSFGPYRGRSFDSKKVKDASRKAMLEGAAAGAGAGAIVGETARYLSKHKKGKLGAGMAIGAGIGGFLRWTRARDNELRRQIRTGESK